MRYYIIILSLFSVFVIKAQVTFIPSASLTPCLGEYKPVSFSTSLIYDSLQWLNTTGNVIGTEDTLIIGPNIAPTTSFISIDLQLFYQGTKYPTYKVYIVPTQPFPFSLNDDTTTCIGDSVNIRVRDPNNAISKITWRSNRADFIPPTFNPVNGIPKSYKTVKPGKYWVSVTNLNETCRLSDTITIEKINQPVDLGPDVEFCNNELVYLENTNPNSITGTRSIWSYNGKQKESKGLYPTESGIHELRTISPTPHFCEFSDEVNVTINEVPEVDLPSSQTICKGESTVIANSLLNNTTYTTEWETSNGTLPIIGDGQESIVVRTPGTYYLSLKTPFCTATDSTTINLFQFDVDLGSDIPDTCNNGSYTLKNLAASTEPAQTYYLWRTPGGNSLEREVIADKRGEYILNVTSDFPQCEISDTIFVALNEIPEFDLGENKETQESFFTFDGSFSNKFPSTNFNFNWSSLDSDSIYSTKPKLYIDQPGEYNISLEVTNKFSSCTSNDWFVIIIPEEPIISSYVMYIPDAISPTALNEENSKLKVQGPDIDTENFEFKLFNRWGEIVFETVDFDFMKYEGWDGTSASSETQNGTYTYTTKGQFKDGKTFSLVGTVSVLR